MHHAGWNIELDKKTLVPAWRDIVGEAFHRRSLTLDKLEISDHPRGIRVHVIHVCSSPCPWTVDVFEHAAFDATQALRHAWDTRNAAPSDAGSRFIVFNSWQSTSPKTNRNLIESALVKAVNALKKDDTVTIEPVVDRDTAGIAGSPDISATIFAKIEKASCFVADVSLVLQDRESERRSPNPNVLLELGYAAHALGWDRIILVANTAFGPVEDLPFDLRGRRVASYEMAIDGKAAEPRLLVAGKLDDALRYALSFGTRKSGESSTKEKIRRLLVEVSKANHTSYAPVMVASTIRFPGVSRDEYRQRLNAVLATSTIPIPASAIPDPGKKRIGPLKGEIVHLTAVDDDAVSLEIPPNGLRVRVPLDQVISVWQHRSQLIGMKLGLAIVVPDDPTLPATLESE